MLHFDIDCVIEWFVMKQKETYSSVISAPVLINITELSNNCNSCELHVKKMFQMNCVAKQLIPLSKKAYFSHAFFSGYAHGTYIKSTRCPYHSILINGSRGSNKNCKRVHLDHIFAICIGGL